jgi:glycogen debranching enzyme
MSEDLVRILDGNTFAIGDARGDMEPSTAFPNGLFQFDTRYLSTWQLTINGERLRALSVDDLKYYEVRFFLVPGSASHYVDAKVSVIRQWCIERSLEEQLTVLNHDVEPVDLTIRIEAGSDFADMFEIKDVQHKKGRHYVRVEGDRLRLGYRRESFCRETLISTTQPAQIDEHGLTFPVRIAPHGSWVTTTHAAMLGSDDRSIRTTLSGGRQLSRLDVRQEIDKWLELVPRLGCSSEALAMAYRQSIIDLCALRFEAPSLEGSSVPAAGLPWFMTIFGRDSILTSLQALPFTPDLAEATLRLLGELQGRHLDDFRDEEPGKILHEARYGESAAFEEQPHSPYYGSADATPLFVVLLDEYERWTGDAELVRSLERFARPALDWIDEYGDIMGDGYIWYQSRNERTGLENQCWKDSWDGISYRDGRIPGFPRATCELQGYAYDAKLRGARLARRFWQDPAYADRLERQAADLKRRFNRDFWVDDGEYYALALDPDGHQVDALTSNIGHLLWSGIVDTDRAAKLVAHLTGPRLYSGWGVRTLAEGEGRYNPVGYHIGTVWPFDNSFIAWGLRRYGFREEAARIAKDILDAAYYFQGRLPEAFAGYDRELTKYPVEYPTACSPQAWSTGTPMLLLRTMLGMEPRGEQLMVDPALPDGMGRMELLDVPGRWGVADAFGRARL